MKTNLIIILVILSLQLFYIKAQDDLTFKMPDEGDEHERTWVAFIANEYIWSEKQIPRVKEDLALLAKTIAKYEPVAVLVRSQDYDEAVEMIGQNHKYEVEFFKTSLDDFWLRDTGATFVIDQNGEKNAIDFNFNGWGNKQEHSRDKKVAEFIAQKGEARLINTDLVVEGGSFEVDGKGTALMTESSVLIDNRNPGVSKEEFEKEIKALLGLEKILWVEGIKGKDITDAHIDFYARFVHGGKVLVSRENYQQSYDYDVTRKNIETLTGQTDAEGNTLDLVILDNPDTFNEEYGTEYFAPGYIGYYLCNGAVIMQKFGDSAKDANAKSIIEGLFPDRVIEQLQVDGIASGGGSIHCATQQQIKGKNVEWVDQSSQGVLSFKIIVFILVCIFLMN